MIALDDYRRFKIISEDKRVFFEVEERRCPECEGKRFKIDKEYYVYCVNCGLVLAGVSYYSAGIKIDLPWGLLY